MLVALLLLVIKFNYNKNDINDIREKSMSYILTETF